MMENNQEGYRTLGWIMRESEQGLFVVVADEPVQKEIMEIYRDGMVEIYDYRRYPGACSFQNLQKWIAGLPETHTFMAASFHLAVQDDESLKRLNFSRDMLERSGKNLIFLITPYGDERLAVGAYDFYSFVKLRITFQNYKYEKEEKVLSVEDDPAEEREWEPEKSKEKLKEAYALTEQVKEEYGRAHYYESEKLLLKALKIKKKLFGPEHLEIAEINGDLAYI